MKVQPTPLQTFEHGDIVFYKHGIDDEWHGEGKIIGQDGKQVYLKHNGRVISTSPPRLHKPPVPMLQMVYPRSEATPTAPQPPTHGLRTLTGPLPQQRPTDTDSDSSSSDGRNNSESDSSDDEDSSGDETPGRRGDLPRFDSGPDMSGSNGPTQTRQSPDFSTGGDFNPVTSGASEVPGQSPPREVTQIEGFNFRPDQEARRR